MSNVKETIEENSEISTSQVAPSQQSQCENVPPSQETTKEVESQTQESQKDKENIAEGVSAPSFIQAFTLTHTTFSVQLASPGGKSVEYVNQDDNSRRWLNDFRTKSFSQPISLESIEASRYSALLLPSSPGAVNDLAHNRDLAQIINHFVKEKKPICAVGLGVTALCGTRHQDALWAFNNYSMTATSVYELARTSDFESLSIIPEDFIKDNGAKFSGSEPDAVHVVIDRHLITGQNEQSTLTAVQNLILLCNQRNFKPH